MQNVKLGSMVSALFFSIGCTAESSRTPVPVPPPTVVAATPVDSPALASPAVISTIAVCAPLAKPVVPAPPVSDDHPQVDAFVYLDSLERKALATAEGKASRVGSELQIRLLNGKTRTFRDDTVSTWVLPRYAGYLKAIHAHIVHSYPMEGDGYHLIVDDSTGDSTKVWGMPVPSPDGARFALTSMAGEDWASAGLIEVWRMVGRKPEKEYSLNTENEPWEASDAAWRDSITVDFMKNTHSSPADPYLETPACLGRTGTTWVMSGTQP
jgi:hypothetical protein